MSIKNYLRGKILPLILLLGAMGFTSMLLYVLKMNRYTIGFIDGTYLLAIFASAAFDYYKKRTFYKAVQMRLEGLDQKSLLCEMVERPDFFEGDFLCDVLQECNKSMNDQIAQYRHAMQDYREYVEAWVHEIKTPIASASLLYENNKNEITQSMNDELQKIDGFVEQALYYCRSNTVEKDYAIKKCSLLMLVNRAVKKHARQLIESKIAIETHDLDETVFTDAKWTDFILGQIISNSIKYKSENAKLTFSSEKISNGIILYITDNGIGIPEQDVEKIFEKGFTGENGHKYTRSTGIGLYLCKKLCQKLGLKISLLSEQDKGTTVKITFPISEMHNLNIN
jgi:signal transduction histidine kinase